jgi:hypothetical protein
MEKMIPCPGCDAELRVPALDPGTRVQCPHCRRVLKVRRHPSTAVRAGDPIAIRSSIAEDHELFDEPPRLVPLNAPLASWFSLLARLALAIHVGAWAMPAAYFVYDWLTPPGIQDGGRPTQPPREITLLMDHASFWIQITFWPAAATFVLWIYVACRDACLMATQLKHVPSNVIVGLFVPLLNIVVLYLTLQQLWRASDPDRTKRLDSWEKTPPSELIRVWVVLFLSVPFAIAFSLFLPWYSMFIALPSLYIAIQGALMIAIIRSITRRQQERYRRLYEEPAP